MNHSFSSNGNRLRVGYVVGSNHTGSTLLALFMDTHPQVVSVGETSPNMGFKPGRGHCSCGDWIRECKFWGQIFHAVTQQGVELNSFRWSTDYRYRNPLLHRLLSRLSPHSQLRALQQAAARFLPGHRSRVRHIDRANVLFIRSILDMRRAQVLFDTSKYPARLFHLLQIEELDVRVIRMLRDVRSFASSEKKRGRTVENAARVWLAYQRVIEALCQTLEPERVLVLKYEDMCRDATYWFQQLHAFLGVEPLPPPSSVVPRHHHILGNPIRKSELVTVREADNWTTRLTPMEVERVMRVAGTVNERLGYA